MSEEEKLNQEDEDLNEKRPSAPRRQRRQRKRSDRDWEKLYREGDLDADGAKDDTAHSKRRVAREPDSEQSPAEKDTEGGIVLEVYSKECLVSCENSAVLCALRGSLRRSKRDRVIVGDDVRIVRLPDATGVVEGVEVRRSKLSRPDPNNPSREKIVAANIQQVVVTTSADRPPFRPGLVDRFVVAAHACGLDYMLCVNKIDLVDAPPAEVDVYRELGIPVIISSTQTSQGIAELRDHLEGKRSVFVGHSGVGKTSLLKALRPDIEVSTRSVSAVTGKGRHSTTRATLYHVGTEGIVIDTAGIREFGLWRVSQGELSRFFPEFGKYAADCKFSDCAHLAEPECAVTAAVERGEIAHVRYESYVRITNSMRQAPMQ